MVETGKKGKFVLTASTMGLIGFAGYSSYAPTKYALRGLAESLRNEFLMYGIGVHIYYPGTMFSPGYENEVSHFIRLFVHMLTKCRKL